MHYMKWIYPRRLRNQMILMAILMVIVPTLTIGYIVETEGRSALMNPLMILVKIIKLRWIHILSYDQMVSRKINNQTTRCANS
ncbi:hypothetical protein RRI15_10110, partial [Escherichia coli]|nr:hypothetical protein [Escherichia coli]MDT8576895.1 hypothetical protein [Escherichia coli]